MPKEDTTSTKKNMDLKRAIRRDWVADHKGALIGTGVCVVAAAAAIALAITRPWVSDAHILEQTAAIVDGDRITEQDVADYVDRYRRYIGKTTDEDWATFMDENSMTAESVRTQAINRLEQQHIINKAAKEANIMASDEEIDEKITAQREKASLTDDDQEWNSWLDSMGYTPESYRKDIEYGIIEDKYVATQVTPVEPSESSMESHATSNIDDYTGRKAQRILFKLDSNATASQVNDAKAKAQAVIDELGEKPSKEDFLKKAEELAKDKKVTTNDMGWDCVSSYEVMTQKELDTLEAGQMSDEPVRDGDGFNVLYCTETYLPDKDGKIDIASMPDPIAKILREDTYEESNKNPKNTYLMFLTYNHSVDVKDMPEGLPYDVDMSLSTYNAEDESKSESETTEYDLSDDGNLTLGDDATTTVSDDGSTVVTTSTSGDASSDATADADAATDAKDEKKDDKKKDDEKADEKKPAVEPSNPTSVQTFGDASEDEEN